MRVRRRLASLTAAFALAAVSLGLAQSAEARPKPNEIELQVLSFNDFHGHLQPPSGTDETLGETSTRAQHWWAARSIWPPG